MKGLDFSHFETPDLFLNDGLYHNKLPLLIINSYESVDKMALMLRCNDAHNEAVTV